MLTRDSDAIEFVLHEARENDVKFIRLWFSIYLEASKDLLLLSKN